MRLANVLYKIRFDSTFHIIPIILPNTLEYIQNAKHTFNYFVINHSPKPNYLLRHILFTQGQHCRAVVGCQIIVNILHLYTNLGKLLINNMLIHNLLIIFSTNISNSTYLSYILTWHNIYFHILVIILHIFLVKLTYNNDYNL